VTIARPPDTALPFPGRRPARLSVEKYEAMVASGLLTKRDRLELIEGNLVQKMTKHPPYAVTTGLSLDGVGTALPAGWHTRQEQPVRIPGPGQRAGNGCVGGSRYRCLDAAIGEWGGAICGRPWSLRLEPSGEPVKRDLAKQGPTLVVTGERGCPVCN
jgi:hypothetical protein